MHPSPTDEARAECAVVPLLEQPVVRDDVGRRLGAVRHDDRDGVAVELRQPRPHGVAETARIRRGDTSDAWVLRLDSRHDAERVVLAGVVDHEQLVVDLGVLQGLGEAGERAFDRAGLIVRRDYDRELQDRPAVSHGPPPAPGSARRIAPVQGAVHPAAPARRPRSRLRLVEGAGALVLLGLLAAKSVSADRAAIGIVDWPGTTKTDLLLAGCLAAGAGACLGAGVGALLVRFASFAVAALVTLRTVVALPTLALAPVVLAGALGLLAAATGELAPLVRGDPQPVDRYHAAVLRFARSRARPGVELVLATLAVSTVTWNPTLPRPDTGVDASWQAGLYLAVHDGLQFGKQVVFTYGPLGFLHFPVLYYSDLALGAYLYTALLQAATLAAMIWCSYGILRSRLGALIVAGVGISVVVEPAIWQLGYGVPVAALAFIWCARALDLRDSHPVLRALPVGGGLLAGIELLTKLTIGVLVATLFAYTVAVASRPRRRDAAIFAGALAAGLLAGWALAGQSLGALPAYLARSRQVVDGYSEAMGGPIAAHVWAAAALALALLAAAVLAAKRDLRGRAAVLGLLALYAFQNYKAAFVTGGSHIGVYFAGAVAAWFGLPWRRVPRLAALAALAALIGLFGWATSSSPVSLVAYGHPLGQRLRDLRPELEDALLPGRRGAGVAQSRARLRARYRIAPRLLAAIGRQPVHVDPWEATVAWAYDLDWRPIPVFQSYQAYVPALDELNARAYASTAGPAVVLREHAPPPLDRRTSFESPAAVVSMLCHFVNVASAGMWEVVRRVPNRCGAPRPIGRVAFRYGETIPVPRRPGMLVIAKVGGVADSALGGVVATLYRSPVRRITIDGTVSRLVPGTARDGLLLSVPKDVDYPRPFELGLAARTLRIDEEHGSHAALTVSFSAVPIARR